MTDFEEVLYHEGGFQDEGEGLFVSLVFDDFEELLNGGVGFLVESRGFVAFGQHEAQFAVDLVVVLVVDFGEQFGSG